MADRVSRRLTSVIRPALSLAAALAFLLPFWWVVVISLRPLGGAPPRSIEWWPADPAWTNYYQLFDLVPLLRQAGNSLLVGLIAVPLTLITASSAGYAIANLSARLRHRLVVGAVLAMLVPVTALWLTRFVIFKSLGLMNTLGALIVPALGGTNPFYVLLFYWTFRRIPREVFEAARLEGAGHWTIWSRIALPLSRPTMVTVGVLSFSFYWSDLISPLLYLKSEARYTLPVGLSALQQMDVTDGPLLMAGAVLALVPIVLAFLLAHRFFWPDEMLLRPLGIRRPGGEGESGSSTP